MMKPRSVLDNVWGYFECSKCERFAVLPAPSADTMERCKCGEVVVSGRRANQAEILRYGLKGWRKNNEVKGYFKKVFGKKRKK